MPTKTTPLASLPNALSLSTQPVSPRLWSFNTTPRFVSVFRVFFFLFFFLNWVEPNFVGFVQLDDSLFVEIEIGQSVVVDDPDGAFTVTAFDANHCPCNLFFFFYSFWLALYRILLFNWFAHVGFVEII